MHDPPIYLDNHATTRTDPRVVESMIPFFLDDYGNAASTSHRFGWTASDAVDRSREQVAMALEVEAKDVIFTSGATESNNLAIKGLARGCAGAGRDHLITAASEHRAVLDPMKRLAREGWRLTVVGCDGQGLIDPDRIAAAITEKTLLVSVMTANNEVGAINPITEIGQICRARGVFFHTDAAQAVGKIPLAGILENVDLLSLSAHKFHGPKGIGALYVNRRRPGLKLMPLFDGGGHERGLRSGTLPVPLVVGLGAAIELADRERPAEAERIMTLRERLHAGIARMVPAIRLNGPIHGRLPGNLNLSFQHVDGEALLMTLRDLAVSSGSACSSMEPEPSHVLTAMGLDEESARASLRFGLGRFTTTEEIDRAAAAVATAVQALRKHSIAWSAPG